MAGWKTKYKDERAKVKLLRGEVDEMREALTVVVGAARSVPDRCLVGPDEDLPGDR